MTRCLLGVIADDITGACDVASGIREAGLDAEVTIGVPDSPPAAQASVVALKTRSIAPEDAVRESVAALEWLLPAGPRIVYQKYCSTFDSTPRGNIGPVADALLDRAAPGASSVGTPATPQVGRTQYLGHLFVGDDLLEHSPLRHHPLTPMTDSRLVRLLQAQSRREVSAVPRGCDPVALMAQGPGRHLLLDALDDADLDRWAGLLIDADLGWPSTLWTGAAGLASAAARGLATDRAPTRGAAPVAGRRLILAGSCSQATMEQIDAYPGRRVLIDVERLAEQPDIVLGEVLTEVEAHDAVLVQASADQAQLRRVQGRLGVERSASIVESFMGAVARTAVERLGVRQLLIAGGETSGAVAQGLGLTRLEVGEPVAPGVPWLYGDGLAVLFKSGNFGPADLFSTAWEALPTT